MKLLKKIIEKTKKASNKPDVIKHYSVGININGMQCGTCKYFEQGKICSFCGNPQQQNTYFKQYLYYNFGCSLYEKGIAQSRIDYMKTSARV